MSFVAVTSAVNALAALGSIPVVEGEMEASLRISVQAVEIFLFLTASLRGFSPRPRAAKRGARRASSGLWEEAIVGCWW